MTPIRTILIAAATLGTITVSGQAGAVSLAVKMACASDYYAHCSQHSPDSPGVRKCMRAHGPQLSQGCVSALVAAGEVPKSVVEKKVAAK
jgi:hypothetical protein